MSFDDIVVAQSKVIPDVTIIEPSVFTDDRGSIYTSFLEPVVQKYIPRGLSFKHDKFSMSKKEVLRGLHGDANTWKLVSCVYGKIFQVVVDMRPNSRTFLKYVTFDLDGKNNKSILIPPMFANGFQVLSEDAVYHYKLAYSGEYQDADQQFVVKWNDPRLNIEWPGVSPILQKRDK